MAVSDALSELLRLGAEERRRLGVVDTPREISQQPSTWPETVQRLAGRRDEVDDFLATAGFEAHGGGVPHVLLVGAGSSDYVGRSLVPLLRKSWDTTVEAIPSTDLLTNAEDLVPTDARQLWISFSRSGDSSEAVAVLDQALERCDGVRHLLVTCNAEGRFARGYASDPRVLALVLHDSVNDRGLAMTSSFTNMVVAGFALAHRAAIDELAVTVAALADTASELLGPTANLAAALAEQHVSRVLFLGTGASHAAATESALKVVELTAGRIWAASETYLGVRHGPLSALDKSTLVVAMLSRDGRRRAYERDLLDEIRAKELAKFCVAIDPCGDGASPPTADHVLTLATPADIADDYRPVVDVLFGQLFGMFASLRFGLEPDAPSPNGAIGRVVSSVEIHR